MQMVINLAPVSLSNKKVNFYTCPRLTFLKKTAAENRLTRAFLNLLISKFSGGGGGMPPLIPLVLKSDYDPAG